MQRSNEVCSKAYQVLPTIVSTYLWFTSQKSSDIFSKAPEINIQCFMSQICVLCSSDQRHQGHAERKAVQICMQLHWYQKIFCCDLLNTGEWPVSKYRSKFFIFFEKDWILFGRCVWITCREIQAMQHEKCGKRNGWYFIIDKHHARLLGIDHCREVSYCAEGKWSDYAESERDSQKVLPGALQLDPSPKFNGPWAICVVSPSTTNSLTATSDKYGSL